MYILYISTNINSLQVLLKLYRKNMAIGMQEEGDPTMPSASYSNHRCGQSSEPSNTDCIDGATRSSFGRHELVTSAATSAFVSNLKLPARDQEENNTTFYSGEFQSTSGGLKTSYIPSTSSLEESEQNYRRDRLAHAQMFSPTASGSYASTEGYNYLPFHQTSDQSQANHSEHSVHSPSGSKKSKKKRNKKGKSKETRSEDVSGYMGDKNLDTILQFIEGD